ncbi:unnamed protein product [Rhizopus stolonifer]
MQLTKSDAVNNLVQLDNLDEFEDALSNTSQKDNNLKELENDKNVEEDMFKEFESAKVSKEDVKEDIKSTKEDVFDAPEEERVEEKEKDLNKLDKEESTAADKEGIFDAFEETMMDKEGNDGFDTFEETTTDKEFDEFKETTVDKEEKNDFDDFEEETAEEKEKNEFDNFEGAAVNKEENNDFDDFGEETLATQKNEFDAFDIVPDTRKDDFGDFSDDEFGNDFVNANEDDDFGDFDDFEQGTDFSEEQHQENFSSKNFELEEKDIQPTTHTEANIYIKTLEKNPEEVSGFIEGYLNRLWSNPSSQDMAFSSVEKNEDSKNILNTSCSFDLWDKLSRDTVFHNPVTGAVGSFQWTRSEANKAYLNALGVTFTTEEKTSSTTRTQSPHLAKKRPTTYLNGKTPSTSPTASSPTSPNATQTHHRSSSATGGLSIVTSKIEENEKRATKEVDQDLELDIDIAKAYCELTEETIRIFPNVKLHAMVTELSRLQKQAAEYLDHLLDQKEQLLMDAETYNDLISCILDQAQRLRKQNPSKNASPAMVSKKKKSGSSSFSNIMRRKTTGHGTQSASMGGGVVGVQQPPQQNHVPKKTVSSATESRRSL